MNENIDQYVAKVKTLEGYQVIENHLKQLISRDQH